MNVFLLSKSNYFLWLSTLCHKWNTIKKTKTKKTYFLHLVKRLCWWHRLMFAFILKPGLKLPWMSSVWSVSFLYTGVLICCSGLSFSDLLCLALLRLQLLLLRLCSAKDSGLTHLKHTLTALLVHLSPGWDHPGPLSSKSGELWNTLT